MYETAPEKIMRGLLEGLGVDFRSQENILGTPDFYLPKYKMIIFVNGCYWHSHSCQISNSKKEWVLRDIDIIKKLKQQEYQIFIAWECELYSKPKTILKRLTNLVQNES